MEKKIQSISLEFCEENDTVEFVEKSDYRKIDMKQEDVDEAIDMYESFIQGVYEDPSIEISEKEDSTQLEVSSGEFENYEEAFARYMIVCFHNLKMYNTDLASEVAYMINEISPKKKTSVDDGYDDTRYIR